MKNYYEILGISHGASAMEIKKAYFSLVRKYPPDRFPDRFMEIREAYESLSNENTRREYDAVVTMPVEIRQAVQLGQKALEEGDVQEAIRLLEIAGNREPELAFVQNLLGQAYLRNGNTGNAVKVYEKLIQDYPQNAAFAGHYAHACLERGWHKKALKAYQRALELDEDNISLWIGMSEAYQAASNWRNARNVLLEALEKGRDKDWDNAGLYFHLIQIELHTGLTDEMKSHLHQLVDIAVHSPDIRENVAWTLGKVAQQLIMAGWVEEAKIMVEGAIEIMPDDEEIGKLGEEVTRMAKMQDNLQVLGEDKRIKPEVKQLVFLDLLPPEALGLEFLNAQAMQYFAELELLENPFVYEASIRRLKLEYPDFYTLRADFFQAVLEPKKRKKLLGVHRNKGELFEMLRSGFFGDFDDDDDFPPDYVVLDPQKPYVREQPKIGRNEPCPCGSGKKYKKCCGA